jgi:DNA helicase II / ATP-dependent DNA helicase PcrA
MNTALLKGERIDLEKLSREQYQTVYEASLRGEVKCIQCGTEVRMYLGLKDRPHFYHTRKIECDSKNEYVYHSKDENENKEFKEWNGFRLPKSKPIHETNDVLHWKPPQPLKNIVPFKEKQQPILHLRNSSQQKAIQTIEGPVLVLASAGSGKTKVLIDRTAYMIQKCNIHPSRIMLITFTVKAANEIKERLSAIPGMKPSDFHSLVAGTFHSIFYKIISHHDPNRWHASKLLKWDWQKEKIMKEIVREIGLDEKDFAFDQAMATISFWKNNLLYTNDVTPSNSWEVQVLQLYEKYEEIKQQNGFFDFDDMLLGCYELLKNNENLLNKYQNRFQYFMVDEFQDINKVQYEIMKLLSKKSRNLCVVGDDDQSIYAFRGSDPSIILGFEKDYPETEVITLEQNYRSSHGIVQAANQVISKNKNRRSKRMQAQFDNHKLPQVFFPYDEEEEATMIVHDIKEHIEKGEEPGSFAVLYRTHSAARAVFERFSQSNIPFAIESDAESFYQRKIVRELLAFLRLSVNPNDGQALRDILQPLFLKQSVYQDMKAISILEDCTYIEALLKLPNLLPFQQKKLKKIVPLFQKLSHYPPLSAIEMVEHEMGFIEYIKKRGNEGNTMEKGSDDLQDLKVVAKKFTSIRSFLDHVDHMISMNEEMKKLGNKWRSAVQLTTIHRSKGLEYKHVYILGAVDGLLPHDYALESLRNGDASNLEEERRLMYVAMTRAKETLTISVPEMRRGKKAKISRFLNGLV